MSILPNPEQSQAVLVGVHEFKNLDGLPAVASNLTGLHGVLTDPEVLGLPDEHCHVLSQPNDATQVLNVVADAADQARDTLLVYYAGHGLIDDEFVDDELGLAMPKSTAKREDTWLRYESLRRMMLKAKAQRRVVILDCCYSGRALAGSMGEDGNNQLAVTTLVEGSYVLTASSETRTALAPPGEKYTAFSGELITALSEGIRGGPGLINMDSLFQHLKRALTAKSRPRPQQLNRDSGAHIVLARNRAATLPTSSQQQGTHQTGQALTTATMGLPGGVTVEPPGESTARPVPGHAHQHGDADHRRAAVREHAGSLRRRPFQQDMLEQLTIEREVHGNHRNLLVAATGTGKTVMAALDYKDLCQKHGGPLRLLFVAHREEILDHARRTYRDALGDDKFGELHVGSNKSTKNDHLFASIQSFSRKKLAEFAPDHFDVVVIDEFHHGAAETYERLIEHFKPTTEFLALTATPERGDGIHVQDLHFDGRIAAEMRLWEALESELLSPFHYFGIADETDLTGIEWKRGGEYNKQQLSDLLTGDDAQARLIVDELRDKVPNVDSMRALGFCVSVDHANYMARYFNDNGIRSAALDGDSTEEERHGTLEAFRGGKLQVLFSVDLFNEGLDVPDVDTLLMLRPTQSPTIFLQQFGRGLRRTPSKPFLTVLDFIGQHKREYHFSSRYGALTGLSNNRLLAVAEAGFPALPPGCRMHLDEKAKERVVENIRSQIDVNVKRLTEEVREAGTHVLSEFLEHSGRELKQLYKGAESSWTTLLRRADLLPSRRREGEQTLLKRMFTFLHADDERRVAAYTRLLEDGAPSYEVLNDQDKSFARMLVFSLWPDGGGFSSYGEALTSLRPQPEFREELRQVLAYNLEHTQTLPVYDPELPGTLAMHAAYSREECLAALDAVDIASGPYPSVFREGAKWCKSLATDALFVTLEKHEKDFSDETRYDDYAMGPYFFHWQSQNRTSPTSETGKRYQNHKELGSQVLLFVKRFKTNDIGKSQPTTLLGPVEYVQHTGSRPMSIIWKLKHKLPADVLTYSPVTDK